MNNEQIQQPSLFQRAPRRRRVPRWKSLDLTLPRKKLDVTLSKQRRIPWRQRISLKTEKPSNPRAIAADDQALRQARFGWQGSSWTIEEIKAGLHKFHSEFGRYPSSEEIDSYPYLPSTKSIERNFGGLKKLRITLGLPILHSGQHRSDMATAIGIRGKKVEAEIGAKLVHRFGEPFVHREAPIDNNGWKRLDFLVFTRQGKVGVDVFVGTTPQGIKTMFYLKLRKFTGTEFPIFFVLVNAAVDQTTLEHLTSIHSRIKERRLSIHIVTRVEFFQRIAQFDSMIG